MSSGIDWFRTPNGASGTGTLNACYNALDRHVIRGRAEDVAVTLDGRQWTFADLLAEVAAFAGVLRAFGVGIGDEVGLARLSETHGAVSALAVARLGAVASYAAEPADLIQSAGVVVAASAPDLDAGEVPVITVDDSSELTWSTLMRAGRTDPASCADVPGDAQLARSGDATLPVLSALCAGDEHEVVVPPGIATIQIAELTLWWLPEVEK